MKKSWLKTYLKYDPKITTHERNDKVMQRMVISLSCGISMIFSSDVPKEKPMFDKLRWLKAGAEVWVEFDAVYPNPAQGKVFVNFKGSVRVELPKEWR